VTKYRKPSDCHQCGRCYRYHHAEDYNQWYIKYQRLTKDQRPQIETKPPSQVPTFLLNQPLSPIAEEI